MAPPQSAVPADEERFLAGLSGAARVSNVSNIAFIEGNRRRRDSACVLVRKLDTAVVKEFDARCKTTERFGFVNRITDPL